MSFQIALVQFNPIRKQVKSNIKEIKRLLQGIKADLIVLPELSNCGYLYPSPESLVPYCDKNDGSGEFMSALQSIAHECQGLIIAGYAEKEKNLIYNSAAAVSPTGVIGNYRKVHLYSNEKNLFKPGSKGFSIVEWKHVKIGIMICFDWIFPEAARTLALAGAQIIAHPANLVLPFCQDAMITRSIENQVFTITANRIGNEKLENDSLKFTGGSQMTSPSGNVLFRARANRPTVHVEEILPEKALDKSISNENNLFNDRRSNMYQL
jgi:predicted amidohydrolase